MDDVPVDEAANVAILLDAEIRKKIALGIVDVLLGDTSFVNMSAKQNIELGHYNAAALEIRRQFVNELFRDPTFQANMNYVVRSAFMENRSLIAMVVREEMERGKVQVTSVTNSTLRF